MISNDQRIVCERCGTFTEHSQRFGTAQVCLKCSELLVKEGRFYPYAVVLVAGAIGSAAIAAGLMAMNRRRLGEASPARSFWFVAAGLAAVTVAVSRTGVRFPLLEAIANLGATLAVTIGFREEWRILKRSRVARANSFVPALIVLLTWLFGAGPLGYFLRLSFYYKVGSQP